LDPCYRSLHSFPTRRSSDLSFSRALQKARGKLFPFGIFHLLSAKRNSKEVLFYLIGVLPEYQNKGVTAVMFNEYYKTFKAKGIEDRKSTRLNSSHVKISYAV